MTRANKVPVCSLIDFYQCIPDYEDVMHLPTHEIDEKLRTLRSMQKSYATEWEQCPFAVDSWIDHEYAHEHPRNYGLTDGDLFSRLCGYSGPLRAGSSRYESTKAGTSFDVDFATDPTGRGIYCPKDSAVTTPSTLSNKSSVSKSVFSCGEEVCPKYNGKRRKASSQLKSLVPPYYHSSRLFRSSSPCFPDEFDSDPYGAPWMDHPRPKYVHKSSMEPRSLPSSPVHRRSIRSVETTRPKRTRLRPCQSTPDVRLTGQKSDHIFRAQPFPRRIFSNYLSKKREDKLQNRAICRRVRAEELQKASSLPPSMRRRQRENPSTAPPKPKKTDRTEERKSSSAPWHRFRHGLSPYGKVERYTANKRRSRLTATMEARDNLASLLRLQTSRQKLEVESAMAAEEAAATATRQMRARATRLSPIWRSALSRPTTAEDLMLKAARRREEAFERKRRRQRAEAAMMARVSAAPSLMERQSLLASRLDDSSMGGFSGVDCSSKSAKLGERTKPPETSEWRYMYQSHHNCYGRSHQNFQSYLPRRKRSRVGIAHKTCYSDDEVHRHYATRNHRKQPSGPRRKSLKDVYYDPDIDDVGINDSDKRQSRPSSPTKLRTANVSPHYASQEDYSDGSEGEDHSHVNHTSPGYNNLEHQNSRTDMYISSAHGGDTIHALPEAPRCISPDRRNGLAESSNGQKPSTSNSKPDCVRDSSRHSKEASPQHLKNGSWSASPSKLRDHHSSFPRDQSESEGIEAVTRRFEDISLNTKTMSPPPCEPPVSTFEEFNVSAQPCFNYSRSSQSSPVRRRANSYQVGRNVHGSVASLDLAPRGLFSLYQDDNLRRNARSPERHLVHSRSAGQYTT